MTDPDPPGGTVDDTAWLITAPVDSWNALVVALRELAADDRRALSCNVVAIPVDTGVRFANRSGSPTSATCRNCRCHWR
jgi:hypothetical protein